MGFNRRRRGVEKANAQRRRHRRCQHLIKDLARVLPSTHDISSLVYSLIRKQKPPAMPSVSILASAAPPRHLNPALYPFTINPYTASILPLSGSSSSPSPGTHTYTESTNVFLLPEILAALVLRTNLPKRRGTLHMQTTCCSVIARRHSPSIVSRLYWYWSCVPGA